MSVQMLNRGILLLLPWEFRRKVAAIWVLDLSPDLNVIGLVVRDEDLGAVLGVRQNVFPIHPSALRNSLMEAMYVESAMCFV